MLLVQSHQSFLLFHGNEVAQTCCWVPPGPCIPWCLTFAQHWLIFSLFTACAVAWSSLRVSECKYCAWAGRFYRAVGWSLKNNSLQMWGIMLIRHRANVEVALSCSYASNCMFQLLLGSTISAFLTLLVCKPSRELIFLVGGKQELDCSSAHLLEIDYDSFESRIL